MPFRYNKDHNDVIIMLHVGWGNDSLEWVAVIVPFVPSKALIRAPQDGLGVDLKMKAKYKHDDVM